MDPRWPPGRRGLLLLERTARLFPQYPEPSRRTPGLEPANGIGEDGLAAESPRRPAWSDMAVAGDEWGWTKED